MSSDVPSFKAPVAKISSLKRSKLPPQLIRFQVELEEPDRIYFAGDEIKGHVHVDLSDSLPIQGIILRIVGEAYVNVSDEPRPWTVRQMGKIRSTFRARKMYEAFPTEVSSISSPSSASERTDLPEGSSEPPSFFFRPVPGGNWQIPTGSFAEGIDAGTKRGAGAVPEAKKSRGRIQEESNRKFRSHEKYFEHKSYVFGHKYSSTRETMWTGKHSFPFTYCLPSKLPASFHGRFGYVRYFCEASLERHNLPTVQRRAFFSVNSIMDLNADSKADSSASKEKKTNSWCFCCASGTIIVSAKVKRRGFVPGETIPIQAHVLNVSNKTISKTSAKIVQVATYYSSRAFRNHADETIVCEKIEGRISPGESSTWEETGPRIPPIPPSSTMIDCKLITLEYRLDFVVDIIGRKETFVLKMPLRIGTIPMEKTFKRMAEPGSKNVWSPSVTPLPAPIQLKYPKIPEAYSLKCVKGDRNVNRYYFRQIPRSMNSMVGINLRMPNAPLQPVLTDESEAYAPRYITYRELEVEEDKPDKGVRETINGGIGMEGHLVIQVTSPPRRVIQSLKARSGTGTESPDSSNGDTPSERRNRSFSAPSEVSASWGGEARGTDGGGH